MKQVITCENNVDANGNPAGGAVSGKGILIMWQNGPLGRGTERKEPNGCFVETVIEASIQRIEHYQTTKFESPNNARALEHLREAVRELQTRTNERESRNVEGTLEV
jgi:hypothetical protein